jgi:DNA sulfur modification protein DndD
MSDLAADALPLALISPLLIQAQDQGQKELRYQQAKIAQDVLKRARATSLELHC